MHVPGNTGAKRSKFKQDLLLEVVEATDRQACGDAWTLGFVVLGDLNLQLREVTEALQGWHGESSQECLDVVGAGVPCGSHVGVEFFWGGPCPSNAETSVALRGQTRVPQICH